MSECVGRHASELWDAIHVLSEQVAELGSVIREHMIPAVRRTCDETLALRQELAEHRRLTEEYSARLRLVELQSVARGANDG